MNAENNTNRKYSPDEVETSVSSPNISHLFQYFTQTAPNLLTDSEHLLKQSGITMEELEGILEKQ